MYFKIVKRNMLYKKKIKVVDVNFFIMRQAELGRCDFLEKKV